MKVVLSKNYEFDKPLFCETDSIVDICIRACNSNFYHTFRFTCEYNFNFTNKRNNKKLNLTIGNIAVGSHELNKKLKIAQRNGFKFIQTKKLTIKFYARQSNITNYTLLFKTSYSYNAQTIFSEKFHGIKNIRKTFVVISIILFIMHVANGITIIIHN